MDKATREVLTRARDLIANVGWCQGTPRCWNGDKVIGYCARGAIWAAESEMQCYDCDAAAVLQKALGLRAGYGIAVVNDAPSTTKADVLGWFDKALGS